MDIYCNTHTHTRTLYTQTCIQQSSVQYALHTHRNTHSCAHPFTRLYKHAVQIDVRAHALALRSHSHTHTLCAVTLYYMSIFVDEPLSDTFSSSGRLISFFFLFHYYIFFGRLTMRNDSKMEMYDMFPYKATLNPTTVCSLSVCTGLVDFPNNNINKKNKKCLGMTRVAPSLFWKATAANRRSSYCIYVVYGGEQHEHLALGLYTDTPFFNLLPLGCRSRSDFWSVTYTLHIYT